MTIEFFNDIIQGSDEWKKIRCGTLSASEMKHIITPSTLQKASNEKERAHLYELLAQRISGYVEPHYIGDDMLRGTEDEIEAKLVYSKNYATVTDMGFITNDKWGFKIGYSPDGLVGDDGLIECKSRKQKLQVESILNLTMPPEYVMQVQTAMLVSERSWVDFVSYSGGLPMMTLRIYPSETIQGAIVYAAEAFENKLKETMEKYQNILRDKDNRLIPTERKIEQEMHL